MIGRTCVGANDPGCIGGCCVANPDGAGNYSPLADCHTQACAMVCKGFDLHCG